MVVAASVAVGTGALLPGCLLNGPFAPPDAEFRPFHPPLIVEGSATAPTPNSFVPVPMNQTVTFRVCVAYATREPLVARWFLDRAQACVEGNCARTIHQQDVLFSDASPCRQFSYPIMVNAYPNLNGRACIPVDLYITSAFSDSRDPRAESEPAREGDVAHARWFLYDQTMGFPSIDRCCANYGADPFAEHCTQ